MDINSILNEIYSTLGIDEYNIKVEFCDNMYNRLLELEDDEMQKHLIEHKEHYSEHTGTIHCEDNLFGEWIVLISKTSDKYKTRCWISTLAHEVTHIDDFVKFAKYYNLETMKDIMHHV